MKKQILFLVWLLCLMPFSLIGQENQENSVKLKPAQMTGWKAKGLNGNVKVVTSADGESITFNQLANITCYQTKDNMPIRISPQIVDFKIVSFRYIAYLRHS